MASKTISYACILTLLYPCSVACAGSFVTIDPSTGLFRDGELVFSSTCVTYVQPNPTEPGTNSGAIHMLLMDPTRFRDDFRKMKHMGIGAIYMRVGAGMFLNLDGSWRRYEDFFDGRWEPEADQQHAIAMRDKAAILTGLDPFVYTYEFFDFLLDCAEAEGIYVLPMIMDNWSVPRKYDLEEKLTSILYEEVWERTIQDWTKILGRYKDRQIILGYLVEGETLTLTPWNQRTWRFFSPDGPGVDRIDSPLESKDPELTQQFQDFLRLRHGSVEALKSRWGHGYDRKHPKYNDNGVPLYSFKQGYFDDIKRFEDIPLPSVERAKGEPDEARGPHFPYWNNIPFDPVWTDFGYFKSWVYITRLNELFSRLRAVVPNQMFIVSAAWDAVPVWHSFFVTWDFGALDCEVILHGGGYCNAHITRQLDKLTDFGMHEMVLELYQTIAPYRPFSRTVPVQAFGMGEGGLSIESNDPEAQTTPIPASVVDRWITALLMDNFGSGAALANIWDWSTLTGATPERLELHDHPVTESVKSISHALKRDTFLQGREARTLILANGPMLHSLMKPLEYENLVALSSVLAATHRSFDLATTDTVSFGPRVGKVDLNRYDAIFIPQQFALPINTPSEDVWDMLKEWMAAKPERMLCIGLSTLRDAYFNPVDRIPEGMQHLIGDVVPGPLTQADGEQIWMQSDGSELHLYLKNGRIQTITINDTGDSGPSPFLTYDGQIMGVQSVHDNGGVTYYLGVPLGLSWLYVLDPELSGGRLNEQFDIGHMAAFYGKMLEKAGIPPEYNSDPMMQVYISDHAHAVFIRNRDPKCFPLEATVTSPRLATQFYKEGTSVITQGADGLSATVTAPLGENVASVLLSLGSVTLHGDGIISVSVKKKDANSHEAYYHVRVSGDVHARFEMYDEPASAYDYTPGNTETYQVHLRR